MNESDEDVYTTFLIEADGGLTIDNTSGAGTVTIADKLVANSKTIAGYDATVCSAGCDYTSIATAFSTEGDSKSYFVARGTYNETTNITIPSTSTIHFDQVTIDFSTNNVYVDGSLTNNVSVGGSLVIQGDGSASGGLLLYLSGNNNDYQNLKSRVILENGGSSASTPVIIGGTFNHFGNIAVKDISITQNGNVVMIYP